MSSHFEHTPLMQQYHAIKEQYPGIILLFQVGDFYELFFDDAKTVSAFLGIALTARGKSNGEPIPLCGVPLHALDYYLTKLVRGGFKVALCDQLEAPTPGKLVERGVTQVLTPGTLTDTQLLDAKTASYLCAFFPLEHSWGLLFAELLTAQLSATVIPAGCHKIVESELARFFPDELLVPTMPTSSALHPWLKNQGHFISTVDYVSHDDTPSQWYAHFRPDSQALIQQHEALRGTLHIFHRYVGMTQAHALPHFTHMQWYTPEDFLVIDPATQRNLELVANTGDGSRKNSLFHVLDNAVTPMGSRTIKKWIMRPLANVQAIEQRYDAVEHYKTRFSLMQQLQQLLGGIGDIERVVGRIALRRATVHDYRMLADSLARVPSVRELVQQQSPSLLALLAQYMIDFTPLRELLLAAINDDTSHEWTIKKGFDHHLDQMRALVEDATVRVLALETQEQQRTGINSLKIRYNNIHGYYIEITKTHKDAIPADYSCRQTLVGRERFTTPELQQLEREITHARVHSAALEKEVFERIKKEVCAHVVALRKCAYALAHVDALVGFAHSAYANGYTRPILTTEHDVIIRQGKHPVVAQMVGTRFVANDTTLTDEQSLWIITGPNMGGKSTYLRQVALIAVMAHCGSFVPAHSATIPLLDRIFTRIGAGDNVAEGKSTFLVEMEETATICAQATERSLVILDEVGRGTSTFDGLAIAQAVVEHIHTAIRARCLFATHYHELAQLEHQLPGVVSYYAASKRMPQGIIFLYTMTKGAADGSFGIEVAKLAQLPRSVTERAQDILDLLADNPIGVVPAVVAKELADVPHEHSAAITLLKNTDGDNLTPKQALELIWSLKSMVD